MKVCILLVGLCCFCWRTQAESKAYLVAAPVSLRLDAEETVFVQLFGYTVEARVSVFLKTSMAPGHTVLGRAVVMLNNENNHQAIAKVRLYPNSLEKDVKEVILHVVSDEINHHIAVPVDRANGFLFIQTDKPLYTPHQKVKVRAFSMNHELAPAKRNVFLTFKDPDQATVDIQEMTDADNGIPSMQNPFKIPIKPKLGIWTIEASYTDDFTTKAKTDFEVKEYVLPSFSILVEPQKNYISYNEFKGFSFKVSARYLHGAPVANGELFLRYGYVSGKNAPVIIPTSVTRDRLSSEGELELTVRMQSVLQRHDGPRDLDSLVGKYLYITALVQEDTGGITQEIEFASVKFVKSPYHLSLISTPPFIKPGLPYNIQVLVRDHLGKPVSQVPVNLVNRQEFSSTGGAGDMSCSKSSTTGANGLAYFICNVLKDTTKGTLKFMTADTNLPPLSQASLTLEPVTYHSPNQRYLYINTPMFGRGLAAGTFANIQVSSNTASYLSVKTINYLVLSKGKVVTFKSQPFASSIDGTQNLNFPVTSDMVPSIRLLVYFVLDGEGVSELVADSVWMDVKDKCVNGLNADSSFQKKSYRPHENLNLNIKANQDGYVAMSAVDSAVFTLRSNYKDPVSMVLRHIEKSDLGCGGGGGKDNADVFHQAGLTFMTNTNAQQTVRQEKCQAVVRAKRAVTEEEKRNKANTYGQVKTCCEQGMRYIPKSVTCEQFARQAFRKYPRCSVAFKECCEFIQNELDQSDRLVLGRHDMGADFDQAPSRVRSYFPESWLWEVHKISSGGLPLSRRLPDSLTTWEIQTVGMFPGGMCVADPVKVSVNLPLSVDIPLPYQVVRGEQVQLRGSVYNQDANTIRYCVTLTAGPDICLLQSEPAGGDLRTTGCTYSQLVAGGVAPVTFTLLGLQPGEHTLRFTLKTPSRDGDIVEKTLRVVPEGVKQEENAGGRLDPQGLYGTEKRSVVLKNKLPENIVPNSGLQRMLTINGELPGEVVTVISNPEGLKEILDLPAGSAKAALETLLPIIQVYLYLETSSSWDILGPDVQKNSADLRRKIREGQVAITSFRKGDASYSMWMNKESSIMVTAEVVNLLSKADALEPVDHQLLSDSVNWLISKAQQENGSFVEKSNYKSNKVLLDGSDPLEQSVYLTSIVLIALHRATSISDPILQLLSHDRSKRRAAAYISQHAGSVKSVYVQAMATYALTLHNPNSMEVSQLLTSLENLAQEKGNPVQLRYWKESSTTADWLKPDKSSGMTVEMTAYVLLTVLLKGRIHYANPILAWLTQDQHYGEGFYSMADAMLTLEALTEYSRVIPRAFLNQEINIRYSRKGQLKEVHLSQTRPVSTPLEITKDDDIIVSTGFGKGVSSVKLKTVYYQTTASTQTRCNFDLTIEIVGADVSDNPSMRAPHLSACVKYVPPPNEGFTESTLTVMKIQLPTGVEPYLEDLKQFRDSLDQPIISDFQLEGSTVIIQMDTVPSDIYLCVGFRVKTRFRVFGASESLLTVTEPQDRGSLCLKPFSDEQQKLQRLCVGEHCQCMTAACAAFRGRIDTTLTADDRKAEICRPQIKFAFKVKVASSAAEGDFMTYRTTVVEQVWSKRGEFEAVSPGTEVDLVKKATCNGVELKEGKQYMVIGSSGSEYSTGSVFKYRVPLDSDALVENWPAECDFPGCAEYINKIAGFTFDLGLFGC
ncbi:complement C5 [Odontesthes bonariensis]|uniref:complement C5 n=1 Tax=Odontesthes bonariensis TaxID=219752 RepID=UPI003F58440C